jgi:hypothetical protein
MVTACSPTVAAIAASVSPASAPSNACARWCRRTATARWLVSARNCFRSSSVRSTTYFLFTGLSSTAPYPRTIQASRFTVVRY